MTLLTRAPQPAPWRTAAWDELTAGRWVEELEGSDLCVNLAGRSVNCRYNAVNRRAILESRVRSTELLGHLIGALARPPRLWINASTATIYRHSLDRDMNEATGELGGNEPGAPEKWNFSIAVAKASEEAFFRSPKARSYMPLTRWMAGRPGRKTSPSMSLPAARSANAAALRWSSTRRGGSW